MPLREVERITTCKVGSLKKGKMRCLPPGRTEIAKKMAQSGGKKKEKAIEAFEAGEK